MRHPLFSGIVAFLFGLGVFFSFYGMIFAYANWTDPSTSAPGGNIAPPINISPSNQTKSGNLSVGTGLSYWIAKSGDSFALNNNAGTTKFVIGQDGNVGIGTTEPNSKLDVNGTLEVGTGSRGVTLSSSVGDNFQLLTSTNTPYPNFMIGMGNGAGGQDTTKAYIAALPNTVYIMNGNVGIGTSEPTNSLQVTGSTGIKSNYGLTIGSSGGWSPILLTAEAVDKYWNIYSANGGYGATDLVFRRSDADETKTVQLFGNLYVGKYASTSTLYADNVNNRVGIGTTSPGAKLEVAGQVKITGGTPGAGKVLTSDASGLASWTALTGTLPSGTSGQTLRHDGTNWVANSILYNDGAAVHIGTGLNYWITKSGDSFALNNNAGTTKFVIGQDGNVGIGTTAPGQKLEVNGNARINNLILQSTAADNFQLYPNSNTPNPNFSIGIDGTANGTRISGDGAGLYFSVIGAGSASSEKMRITGSGNVGIGTAGPSQKLHVLGTDVGGTEPLQEAQRPTVEIEGIYPNLIIKSAGNASHSSTIGLWAYDGTNTQQWNMGVGQNGLFSMGYTTNQTNPHVGINNYAAASVLSMNTSGNVGIGTTSPGGKLDINNGFLKFSSAGASAPAQSATSAGSKIVLYDGNLNHEIGLEGGGMWFKSDGHFAWYDNSGPTVRMWLTTGGNLGIGTTSPGAKLEVAGQVKITGGTPGAGKVLTSDASGLASWTALTGTLPTGTSGQTLRHDGTNWVANSALYNDGSSVHIGTGLNYWITKSGDSFALNNNAGTTKFVIGQDGNVGIGTTSPNGKFHVAGAFSNFDVGAQDGNDRPSIGITGNYPQLVLMSGVANVNHGPTVSLAAYDSGSSGTFKSWTLGTAGNNATFLDIGYGTSGNPHANGIRGYGTTVMTLLNSGYVGIGTTAPGAKLEVAGDIISQRWIPKYSSWAVLGDGGAGIVNSNEAAYKALMIVGSDQGTGSGRVVKVWDTLDVQGTLKVNGVPVVNGGQWTASGNNIYNSNSGNIGIGSTNPDGKLTIDFADGFYGIHFVRGATNLFGFHANGGIPSIETGASGKLYINGNVGIGTTNPGYTLDVNGSIHSSGTATVDGNFVASGKLNAVNNGANANYITFGTNGGDYYNWYVNSQTNGSGVGTRTLQLWYYPYDSVPGCCNQILTFNGAGTMQWSSGNQWNFNGGATFPGSGIWNTSGNVGIGTTSPGGRLQVSNSASQYLVYGGSGNLSAINAESVGASIETRLGSAYNRAGLYVGNSDLNLLSSGGIALGAGGNTTHVFINTSGNVGIGTAAPGAKLEVAGQVKITGGSPAAGRVLTSDASGLATWQTPASGGITGSGTANYVPKFTGTSALGNSVISESSYGIGIGRTATSAKLEVGGDLGVFGVFGATGMSHLAGGASISGNATVSGSVTAGAFYYSSDAKLKENIVPISDGLDKIDELTGTYFNWKDSGSTSMGLIAQDVEKVFPEAVSTNPETGLKTVDYGKLVAPLIEAVKTQQEQINALKASAMESDNLAKTQQEQIDALETEINEFKSQDNEAD